MKKSIFTIVLAVFAAALAYTQTPEPPDKSAEPGIPASSNVGAAAYPRIAPDSRVTFRLRAPNARDVKLEGGAGLVQAPLDLKRGEDGT